MKNKMKTAVLMMATCVFGMLLTPRGFTQAASLTLPQPLEGSVLNAYFPNPNPLPKDNCDFKCAQQFTIGGSGAYVNRVDMGLVGTNFTMNDSATGQTSTPITCTFTMSITTAFANNAVGFTVYSQQETVTVPANIGESNVTPAVIPLTQTFPTMYLGAGNYYLRMDNGQPSIDGNPTTGCNADFAGGAQANPPANLDWNLDFFVSVPGVGPGFFGMFNTDPSTWGKAPATFAFDLDGPTLVPPPVGGGAFQAVRLVVAGPITPPRGGPVQAQLGFLDAETGALLGPLQQVTLTPGQIESAELNLTPFISRLGQRIEVQPVILQAPGTSAAANPGPIKNLSATLQLLDASTGFETLLAQVAQPGAVNPGPIGTSTLNPQILAGGQTMRFDIVAGQDPCVAQVAFSDASGNPLIPSAPVSLAPGTGTTIDLNADTLGFRLGQRIEVQPMLVPAAPPPALPQNSVCNASVEVFDHLTGRTWSHQSTMVGLPAVQTPGAVSPGSIN